MVERWYLIVGVLLIVLALTGSLVRRLPLTTALLYLGVGVLLGPYGAGLLTLDPIAQAQPLEWLTEAAVIVSLFGAGLKLRPPLGAPVWVFPLRLATLSMVATVALIALLGVLALDLPLGAAVLLGAVLAPTDPVLASDVQVTEPTDQDRLRFGLTGEAGLNDGTAFPFVMLGLGLLHVHELGAGGWRWLAIDVVWAVAGGLAIGAVAGTLVARLTLYLRRTHQQAVGTDDFLALGLIALAYGGALLLHAYGFLAVFAAGLALRRVERQETASDDPAALMPADPAAEEEEATHTERAPAYMAHAVLGFTAQIERIGELALVVLLGAMLTGAYLPWEALWFVPLLFLVIRPLASVLGGYRADASGTQQALVGWFGIRGIGSLYYLTYAITHGLPGDLASRLTALTLTTVAASIVLHGVTVTPLMNWYSRHGRRDQPPDATTEPVAAGAERPASGA